MCIIKEAFVSKYGDKFSIKVLYVSLGFIFSLYLTLWEINTGIYLFKFGPVLLAMIFLYLFIKFRFMLKERREYLLAYFIFNFLIAFSVFSFSPELMMPGSEYLVLSAVVILLFFIIYLVNPVKGRDRR